MLKRVAKILQEECHLEPMTPVVVGVSGGPDSLCLLDLLVRLKYKVAAAHLNHSLRAEAGSDALVVRSMAESLRVPYVEKIENIREFASTYGYSIEEAARITRYRFLFDLAHTHGAKAVVVAHNADDQVETFLMHLLRGSGLNGLRGMMYLTLPTPWSDTIPLARPLLSTWRKEINRYLEMRKINPVQDITNLDVSYQRNRIRHGLLPYLEGYNRRARRRIFTTACLLAGDYEIIEKAVDDAYSKAAVDQVDGSVVFLREAFLSEPAQVQRYMIRKAFSQRTPGLQEIDFDTIERAVRYIESPPRTGKVELGAGFHLTFEGERVWVSGAEVELPTGEWPQVSEPQELQVPGVLHLAGEWDVIVNEQPCDSRLRAIVETNLDPFQCWLDVSRLKLPLVIRKAKAGERYQPLGMDGRSMKVSDLMINVKVPRRARAAWPVISSGETIVWVPGVRAGYAASMNQETETLIHLRFIQDQP